MLEKYLEEIGLSDKEAAIYLALLQFDNATPTEIAKKTKLNRSTVYVVLESLEKKGLTSETNVGKTVHYQAAAPERLETYVEQQQLKLEEMGKRLKDIIPEIKAIQRETGERPIIRVAYGKDAALAQSLEFFNAEHKEGVGYFIFNQDMLDEQYTPKELAKVKEVRPKKQILGKSIYNATTTIPSNELTERKMVDKKEFPITADISIHEDRVHIVTLGEQTTTILIQSKDFANTLKTLFKLAFRSIH
ncbi:MAG TPA: helix-turn-helix domain-containing protein [Candidatus Paceibacterota bacterium]